MLYYLILPPYRVLNHVCFLVATLTEILAPRSRSQSNLFQLLDCFERMIFRNELVLLSFSALRSVELALNAPLTISAHDEASTTVIVASLLVCLLVHSLVPSSGCPVSPTLKKAQGLGVWKPRVLRGYCSKIQRYIATVHQYLDGTVWILYSNTIGQYYCHTQMVYPLDFYASMLTSQILRDVARRNFEVSRRRLGLNRRQAP